MPSKRTYDTIVTNETFRELNHIVSVDLNNRPMKNGVFSSGFKDCSELKTVKKFSDSLENLSYAFCNCIALETVPEIPSGCINMSGTFAGCSKLNCLVNIPSSVTDVTSCFYNCTSLTIAPNLNNSITSLYRTFENTGFTAFSVHIPNSVTNMEWCFKDCNNLVTFFEFSNEVTNLKECFSNCTSLTTVISPIPNKTTNLFRTFYNCINLTKIGDYYAIGTGVTNLNETFYNCHKFGGDIVIKSTNVTNASNCFYSNAQNLVDRNVFIDFNSTTYQSFVSAGYSDTIRKHGVLLLPINCQYQTFVVIGATNPQNTVIQVTYDGNTYTCRNTLSTHFDGACPTSTCAGNIFYLPIPEHTLYTYVATLDGYLTVTGSNGTGSAGTHQQLVIQLTNANTTFTLNAEPSGTTVQLYVNNVKVAEGQDTASFTHAYGETVSVEYICTHPDFYQKQGTITWDSTNNATESIDMRPNYTTGQVLYESNTAGETGTLGLYKDYVYEITCVGGGGGSADFEGGAGSIWKGNIIVKNNVTLNMTTGSGGAAGEERVSDGSNGTSSTASFTNFNVTSNGGRGGSAFTLSPAVYHGYTRPTERYTDGYSITPRVSTSIRNQMSSFNTTQSRRASWISGTNYGEGGNSQAPENGKAGYLKVRYISQASDQPTPVNFDTKTPLLERTSGSGTFTISSTGYYQLTLVGGGGGALYCTLSSGKRYKASGGSGGAFKGTIYLTAGNYNWSVGSAGTTTEYINYDSASQSTDGGNTTFGNCTAYGGQAGFWGDLITFFADDPLVEIGGRFYNGWGGNLPDIGYTCSEVLQSLAGNDGLVDGPNDSVNLACGASVFNGYGKGGGVAMPPQYFMVPDECKPATSGYIKLVAMA